MKNLYLVNKYFMVKYIILLLTILFSENGYGQFSGMNFDSIFISKESSKISNHNPPTLNSNFFRSICSKINFFFLLKCFFKKIKQLILYNLLKKYKF